MNQASALMEEQLVKKIEKEIRGKSQFPQPIQLYIKCGKIPYSFYGVPEKILDFPFEVRPDKIVQVQAYLVNLKRDFPNIIVYLTVPGTNMGSYLKHIKTLQVDWVDKVYRTAMLASLAGLSVAEFVVIPQIETIGMDIFSSPIFVAGLMGVIMTYGLLIPFRWAFKTDQGSFECFTETEKGICHVGYWIDCNIPVHVQLGLYEDMEKVLPDFITTLEEKLNHLYVSERGTTMDAIGQAEQMASNNRRYALTKKDLKGPVAEKEKGFWGSSAGLLTIASAMIGAAALVISVAFGGGPL